jgi:uncharacterized protein YjbI with pentapeptide repeats
MKPFLTFLIFLSASSLGYFNQTHAKDLGYRYVNGKCVNASGEEGLNLAYIGQCGDLRGVIISGMDFSGLDLSGAVFESSQVSSTNFTNSDLTQVSFKNAELNDLDFTGAILHGVQFVSAQLRSVQLSKADMIRVDFSKATLTKESWGAFSCVECRFKQASMNEVDFTGAHLDGVDLTMAQVQSARLAGISLKGAGLDQIHLSFTNLSSADLSGAKSQGLEGVGVVAPGINLEGAKLGGAKFRRADLQGANLKNTDFSQADIRNAILTESVLDGANLSGTKYSKKTALPITLDEANQRGMVLLNTLLMILWDRYSTSDELSSLIQYMDSNGVDVQFTAQSYENFDGSEDLSAATALLHLVDHSKDMQTAGQLALVAYVKNGGTYFGNGMLNHLTAYHGYLKSMSDILFMPEETTNRTPQVLTPVPGEELHPLLEGISNYTFKGALSLATGVDFFKVNKPEILATYTGGYPMLAVRLLEKGKAINFPVNLSGGPNYSGLADPGIQKLLLNTVNWAN